MMVSAPVAPIDAHHHFWHRQNAHYVWPGRDFTALQRDFLPQHFHTALDDAGVSRSVLVQSVNSVEENRRLLSYAHDSSRVAGIVAWLPLDRPEQAGRMLAEFVQQPLVRGVRCLVGQDELRWVRRPDVLALLRDLGEAQLGWDIVAATGPQLRAARAVAEHLPRLRVIIDHLACPPLATGRWQPWARELAECAAAPNMAMKISVGIDVLTRWQWDAAVLRDYVGHALHTFGSARLMLASNWPVVELRRGYADAWGDLLAAASCHGLRQGQVDALRGETARRWYALDHDTQVSTRDTAGR